MSKKKPLTIDEIENEFGGDFKDVKYNKVLTFLDQLIDTTIKQTLQELRMEESKLITSRRFWLVREEDVSEVSGTGVVADGVVFPGGVAVLRWRTAGVITAVYDSIESLEGIHGHDGKTKIEYVSAINQRLGEVK